MSGVEWVGGGKGRLLPCTADPSVTAPLKCTRMCCRHPECCGCPPSIPTTCARNLVTLPQNTKQLLVEEFGKWVREGGPGAMQQARDAFFRDVYRQVVDSAGGSLGAPIAGAAFWQLLARGQEAGASEGGGGGLYGVFPGDAAFEAAANFSRAAAALSGVGVGGSCAPRSAAGLLRAPDCSATWVDGAPGTGMEGPGCSVDVNECARGLASCGPGAVCVDTAGAYECRCPLGHDVAPGGSGCEQTGRVGMATLLKAAAGFFA